MSWLPLYLFPGFILCKSVLILTLFCFETASANQCIDVGSNVETVYPTSNLASYSSEATASSSPTNAYKAFDGGLNTAYQSDNSYSLSAPYDYQGSNSDIDPNFPGEYLQIEFQNSIVITSYEFWSQNTIVTKLPKRYKIYGYSDYGTWIEVTSKSLYPYIFTSGSQSYTVNSPGSFLAFKKWAVVVHEVIGDGASLEVAKWLIRGFQCDSICNGYITPSPSSPSEVYDFRSITTSAEWTAFRDSTSAISSNCQVYDYGGVFTSGTASCEIEIALPPQYNRVFVSFSSSVYPSAPWKVDLLMNSNIRSSQYSPAGSTEFSTSYNTFQQHGTLKIRESSGVINLKYMVITIETAPPTCTACASVVPTASLDASLAHWLRFEDPAALNFDSITGTAVGTIAGTAGNSELSTNFLGQSLHLSQKVTGANIPAYFVLDFADIGLTSSSWTVSIFVEFLGQITGFTSDGTFQFRSSSLSELAFFFGLGGLEIMYFNDKTKTEMYNTLEMSDSGKRDTADLSSFISCTATTSPTCDPAHITLTFDCVDSNGDDQCDPGVYGSTEDLSKSKLTLYIDGVQSQQYGVDVAKWYDNTDSDGLIARKLHLGIGRDYYLTDTYFSSKAKYDDLRIYSRVLTQPEIALLAAQTSSADEISPCTTSRVFGDVRSSDIGDGTGDHYIVFDDPATTFDIAFDQEYDVDFFLLGGGGGGADNRGGAGGSGAAIIFMSYRVQQGKTYTFDVGTKGLRGTSGNNGGDSIITVDGTTIFAARGGGGGSQCCGTANPHVGKAGGSSGSSGTNHANYKAGQPANPSNDNIIPSGSTGTSTIETAPTIDSTLRYRVMGNTAGYSDSGYTSNEPYGSLDSDGAGGIGAAGEIRTLLSSTTGYPGRGGDGAAETTVQNQDINFKNYFSSSSVTCDGVSESNGLCYYGGGGHGSTTCSEFPATNSPRTERSLGGGGLSALLGTENGVTYQNRVNAIGRGSGGAGGQGYCGGGTTGNGGDGSDGLIMIRIKNVCSAVSYGQGGTSCTSCPTGSTSTAGATSVADCTALAGYYETTGYYAMTEPWTTILQSLTGVQDWQHVKHANADSTEMFPDTGLDYTQFWVGSVQTFDTHGSFTKTFPHDFDEVLFLRTEVATNAKRYVWMKKSDFDMIFAPNLVNWQHTNTIQTTLGSNEQVWIYPLHTPELGYVASWVVESQPHLKDVKVHEDDCLEIVYFENDPDGLCTKEVGIQYDVFVRLSTGAPEFEQCPAGSTSTAGATSVADCTACQASNNEYQPSTGQTRCLTCPAHMQPEAETAATHCLCVPGYTYNVNIGLCEPCGVGEYKPDVGNHTSCVACGSGGTTKQTASHNLSQCVANAGHTGADGSASFPACAAGTYKTDIGDNACTECPDPDTTSAEGSDELVDCVCRAGFFHPSTSNTEQCDPCATGSYQPSQGKSSCVACGSGGTTEQTASEAASQCVADAGHTGADGSASFPACAAGTYKTDTGSAACLDCSTGATSPAGSTSPSACACNAGYSPATATMRRLLSVSGQDDIQCTGSQEVKGFYEPKPGFKLVHSWWPPYKQDSTVRTIVYNNWGWNGILDVNTALQKCCVDGTIAASDTEVTVSCAEDPNCVACQISSPNAFACFHFSVPIDDEYVTATGGATAHGWHNSIGYQYQKCPESTSSVAPASNGGAGAKASAQSCVACTAGQYKAYIGDVACSDCDVNANSPEASTALTDCVCNAGFIGSGETCAECAAGTYTPSFSGTVNGYTYVGNYELKESHFFSGHNHVRYLMASDTSLQACQEICSQATANDDNDLERGVCVAISWQTTGECYNLRYASTTTYLTVSIPSWMPVGNYGQASGDFQLYIRPWNGASDACVSCPPHAYSPAGSDALSDCTCNAGYAGAAGETCQQCEADTYADTTEDRCISCPSDASAPAGSDENTDCVCNAGYSGPAGGSCAACKFADNAYAPGTGFEECLTCPANSEPAATTASEFCLCKPGHFFTQNDTCVVCEMNTYKDNKLNESCTECPTGAETTHNGSTSIETCQCIAGMFRASSHFAEACIKCETGKYKPTVGEDLCTDCPAGSTTLSEQSIDLDACKANLGYTGPDGGPFTPCQLGSYKHFVGSDQCILCPHPGVLTTLHVASTDLDSCETCTGAHSTGYLTTPVVTHHNGLVDNVWCICAPGYYDINGHGVGSGQECRSCEDGYACRGSVLAPYDSFVDEPCGTVTNTVECACLSRNMIPNPNRTTCVCDVGYYMVFITDLNTSEPSCSNVAKSCGLDCDFCTYSMNDPYNTSSQFVDPAILQRMFTPGNTEAVAFRDALEIDLQQELPVGTIILQGVDGLHLVERIMAKRYATDPSYNIDCGEGNCNSNRVRFLRINATPTVTHIQINYGSSMASEPTTTTPGTEHATARRLLFEECAECPENTYRSNTNHDACSACDGNLQSQNGSTQQSDCGCRSGFYLVFEPSSACHECSESTYMFQDYHRETTCIECPTYSDTRTVTGSTGIEACQCKPGYELAGSTDGGPDCVQCPAGKYSNDATKTSDGNMQCVECSTGKTTDGGVADSPASCSVCSAGYFIHNDGVQCVECEAGKYKVAPGNHWCAICGDNQNSPVGSVAIQNCSCNAGHFRDEDNDCVFCMAGQYALQDDTRCIDCHRGMNSLVYGGETVLVYGEMPYISVNEPVPYLDYLASKNQELGTDEYLNWVEAAQNRPVHVFSLQTSVQASDTCNKCKPNSSLHVPVACVSAQAIQVECEEIINANSEIDTPVEAEAVNRAMTCGDGFDSACSITSRFTADRCKHNVELGWMGVTDNCASRSNNHISHLRKSQDSNEYQWYHWDFERPISISKFHVGQNPNTCDTQRKKDNWYDAQMIFTSSDLKPGDTRYDPTDIIASIPVTCPSYHFLDNDPTLPRCKVCEAWFDVDPPVHARYAILQYHESSLPPDSFEAWIFVREDQLYLAPPFFQTTCTNELPIQCEDQSERCECNPGYLEEFDHRTLPEHDHNVAVRGSVCTPCPPSTFKAEYGRLVCDEDSDWGDDYGAKCSQGADSYEDNFVDGFNFYGWTLNATHLSPSLEKCCYPSSFSKHIVNYYNGLDYSYSSYLEDGEKTRWVTSQCTSCPAHSSHNLWAQTSVDACLCEAGWFRPAGSTTCEACAADTYKTDAGNDANACVPCHEGRRTTGNGSTVSTDCVCDRGLYESPALSCVHCLAGEYKELLGNDKALCLECGVGQTTQLLSLSDPPTSADVCVCQAGYFSQDIVGVLPTEELNCAECPSDHFCAGGSAFEPCPVNTTSPKLSASQTQCECKPGYTISDSGCEMCAEGKFKTAAGSHECAYCYTEVPQNVGFDYPWKIKMWFSPAGSTDYSQCVCERGHYFLSDCTGCPKGKYQPHRQKGTDCLDCPDYSVNWDLTDPMQDVVPASTTVLDCKCNTFQGFVGPAGGPCGLECPPGSRWSEGEINECVNCEHGSFKSETGSSETCTQCPANSGHADEGQTSIDSCKCNRGFVRNGDWSNSAIEPSCVECAAGKFNNYRDEEQCFQCYQYTDGDCLPSLVSQSQSCIDICKVQPGYGANHDNSSISLCAENTYNDGSSVHCNTCPTGSSHSDMGSTSLLDCVCQQGFTRVGEFETCVSCLPGQYKDTTGDGECLQCPLNSISTTRFEAIDDCFCPKGFSGADGTVCAPCAAGTYKNTDGPSECAACPPHTSSPLNSSRFHDCKCVPGYEQTTDNALCSACPVGKFKTHSGNGICTSCGEHTQTATNASVSRDACACKPGFTDGDISIKMVDGKCVSMCGPGSYYDQDFDRCEPCAEGTYKTASGSQPCTECTAPRNFTTPGAVSEMNCTCAAGEMSYHRNNTVRVVHVSDLKESDILCWLKPDISDPATCRCSENKPLQPQVINCTLSDYADVKQMAITNTTQDLQVSVTMAGQSIIIYRCSTRDCRNRHIQVSTQHLYGSIHVATTAIVKMTRTNILDLILEWDQDGQTRTGTIEQWYESHFECVTSSCTPTRDQIFKFFWDNLYSTDLTFQRHKHKSDVYHLASALAIQNDECHPCLPGLMCT